MKQLGKSGTGAVVGGVTYIGTLVVDALVNGPGNNERALVQSGAAGLVAAAAAAAMAPSLPASSTTGTGALPRGHQINAQLTPQRSPLP